MSKYLNVFNTLSEYQAFSASTEYVQPNVALVKETNVLYYDYGDNKPQADMSNYKVESQETSVGGGNYGKGAITKVNYIPSGTTDMTAAFADCSKLVSVPEIPSRVKNLRQTFSGCTSLVNAPEIPSGVTDMIQTFCGCISLVNAPSVIPSGVTRMDGTFQGCERLVTAPEMPSGITYMAASFYDCIKLTNVPPLPSSLTNMRETFRHCRNLNKIEIPSGVTGMSYTFWNAIIRELTLLPTTPPYYSDTLQYQYGLQTIYVPDESVDTYKAATGWSEFADMIKPLSSKPTE